MIKRKSTQDALVVLGNMEAKRGNPVELQKVVDGTERNCLWGMMLQQKELKPLGQFTSLSTYSTIGHFEIDDLLSSFGVFLNKKPLCSIEIEIESAPLVAEFVKNILKFAEFMEIGDYLVSTNGHYLFLKKSYDGSIRLYDSAIDQAIGGGICGFSYTNEGAMTYLWDFANRCNPGQRKTILFNRIYIATLASKVKDEFTFLASNVEGWNQGFESTVSATLKMLDKPYDATQLKDYLNVLSEPITALNSYEIDLESIKFIFPYIDRLLTSAELIPDDVLLHMTQDHLLATKIIIRQSLPLGMKEEELSQRVKSRTPFTIETEAVLAEMKIRQKKHFYIQVERVLDKVKRMQNDPQIQRARAKIDSIRETDPEYKRLTTSNMDILGLSKNIVISQRGISCAIHSLFNYLRSRSQGEFETIKSNSTPAALAVLKKMEEERGRLLALREVVDGFSCNCLWGIRSRKLGVEKCGLWGCVGTGGIYKLKAGTSLNELEEIANDFGLKMLPLSVYNKVEDRTVEGIRKIMQETRCGSYYIGIPGHAMFLEKTADCQS